MVVIVMPGVTQLTRMRGALGLVDQSGFGSGKVRQVGYACLGGDTGDYHD